MTRREHDETYDLLSQYLQEISKIPRLTPERERELGYRVRQGDDTVAIEELVKANLRFVVSYAKRFRNAHVLFLDLINEGNIGLIQAAKKFDPDKNVKFITYAVWWIRQAILHALSEQGGAFRLPPKRANLLYKLEKTIGSILNEHNRMPTVEELATLLDVPVKEIEFLMQTATESFSLSSELDSESHTELGDILEQTTVRSAEDELEEQFTKEELLHHLASLSSKERLILTLRHGISDNVPKRIEEIACFMDRDPEAVGNGLTRACQKVCAEAGVSMDELAHLLLYTNPNPKASWTYWVWLGDLTASAPAAVSSDRAETLELLKQHGCIQSAIEHLPIDERTYLKLRFGILQDEELTLRDIGELLGLSRERVRQIESRAEAKCRKVATRRPRNGSKGNGASRDTMKSQ
ncbi:MAG TPA: sigma-70 family RNA polymerase sigma factor [Thermoanaerobaculia bacterium]|nr:sigma-70 family RNA polymerase sigma factor [Thermoanaerobaculia bacterium]